MCETMLVRKEETIAMLRRENRQLRREVGEVRAELAKERLDDSALGEMSPEVEDE